MIWLVEVMLLMMPPDSKLLPVITARCTWLSICRPAALFGNPTGPGIR
jgi:hypothetical protein